MIYITSITIYCTFLYKSQHYNLIDVLSFPHRHNRWEVSKWERGKKNFRLLHLQAQTKNKFFYIALAPHRCTTISCCACISGDICINYCFYALLCVYLSWSSSSLKTQWCCCWWAIFPRIYLYLVRAWIALSM